MENMIHLDYSICEEESWMDFAEPFSVKVNITHLAGAYVGYKFPRISSLKRNFSRCNDNENP
jgi:hypothetical protein